MKTLFTTGFRRASFAPMMGQEIITPAFVVVVIGGLGSIPGAFLAALLIAQAKAFCIGLGYSEATLVIEFFIMAAVLVVRPWGLLGRVQVPVRNTGFAETALEFPAGKSLSEPRPCLPCWRWFPSSPAAIHWCC